MYFSRIIDKLEFADEICAQQQLLESVVLGFLDVADRISSLIFFFCIYSSLIFFLFKVGCI